MFNSDYAFMCNNCFEFAVWYVIIKKVITSYLIVLWAHKFITQFSNFQISFWDEKHILLYEYTQVTNNLIIFGSKY